MRIYSKFISRGNLPLTYQRILRSLSGYIVLQHIRVAQHLSLIFLSHALQLQKSLQYQFQWKSRCPTFITDSYIISLIHFINSYVIYFNVCLIPIKLHFVAHISLLFRYIFCCKARERRRRGTARFNYCFDLQRWISEKKSVLNRKVHKCAFRSLRSSTWRYRTVDVTSFRAGACPGRTCHLAAMKGGRLLIVKMAPT